MPFRDVNIFMVVVKGGQGALAGDHMLRDKACTLLSYQGNGCIMGCNPHPRGWVWRGGGDRIRATCCHISSVLISSFIFYIYGIFSLIILFLKICMQCDM